MSGYLGLGARPRQKKGMVPWGHGVGGSSSMAEMSCLTQFRTFLVFLQVARWCMCSTGLGVSHFSLHPLSSGEDRAEFVKVPLWMSLVSWWVSPGVRKGGWERA